MSTKIYLKNTNGQPSASLTMAMVSFVLTTAWLTFWVVGTTFGLPVPAFDATVAMGYMTPLLGLYFGRRWTEGKVTSTAPTQSEEASSTSTEETVEEDDEEEETHTTTGRS